MKALLALFSYEANTFNPEVNTVEAAFRQNGVWRVGAPKCVTGHCAARVN